MSGGEVRQVVELSGTPGADGIKQLWRGTVQFLAGIELCATAAAAQGAGRRARWRRQTESRLFGLGGGVRGRAC